MRILWGPLVPSNSESHWVQASIRLPSPSTAKMLLRHTRWPSSGRRAFRPMDPTKPAKPEGTGSGSRNSPRWVMKMRSGDSANTPEWEPQAKPASANGFIHPSTML